MSDTRLSQDAGLKPQVRLVCEDQGGHINRAQLRALRVTDRQIRHWSSTGYLIHVYRNVYAVARRSDNPIDHCHAALLAVGERCAMAGWSAGCLWGLKHEWEYPLEVVTPLRRSVKGLVVHRNTRLVETDITTQHNLKVTSPALTILHVASTLTDHKLERAIDDLRFADYLELDHFPKLLARFPRHAGTRRLERILGIAHAAPTRSDWEQEWRDFAAAYHLPAYVMNQPLTEHPDIRPDILFLPRRLIVELDGRKGHDTPWAVARDEEHDQRVLATLGIPTLRFRRTDLTEDPDRTAAQILAQL